MLTLGSTSLAVGHGDEHVRDPSSAENGRRRGARVERELAQSSERRQRREEDQHARRVDCPRTRELHEKSEVAFSPALFSPVVYQSSTDPKLVLANFRVFDVVERHHFSHLGWPCRWNSGVVGLLPWLFAIE